MRKALPWLLAATSIYVLAAIFAATDFDDRDYEGNQDAFYNTEVGFTSKVLVAKDGLIYEAGTGTSDNNGTNFVLIKYELNESGQLVFNGGSSTMAPRRDQIAPTQFAVSHSTRT